MSITIQPPRAKQAWSIKHATARINIWDGAVRSGKTYGSIWAWIFFAVYGPPGPLLMIGKTERTLKRNILDPILDMVGPDNFRLIAGAGECYLYGRRIMLVGANDERSEGKIRGLTLVGAYGDELTLWPKSFFTMLLSRLSLPDARLFGTTNPDSPFHWLHEDYLERAGELNLKRFQFTLDDNPALPADYVAALKKEYVGLWHKRFILGLWVRADGVVYDLDPETYITDVVPERVDQVRVAVDYGTANPTVFLLLGRWQNRWYVAREYVHDSRQLNRQKTDAQYGDDLVAFLAGLHPQSIEVDPSAASFIAELRHRGLPVRQARNDVLDGIRTVSRVLGSDLVIARSCTSLLRELAAYAWDAKAQDKGDDKPLKERDHGPDALRYGAMRIFGTRGAPIVDTPKAA